LTISISRYKIAVSNNFFAPLCDASHERLFLCLDESVMGCYSDFRQSFTGIFPNGGLVRFAVMPTDLFVRLTWTLFARVTQHCDMP
jgi:hypothetical protein